MEPYAEVTCVLKVNVQCQACKMKMMEVLGSICGIYDVEYNSEEGLAKIRAVVEPNLFLKALARTDRHAECKWVKLRHPKMNSNYYYTDCSNSSNYGNGYNFGAIDDPYNHRRALPDYVDRPSSNHYSTMNPYYNGSYPYYNGSGPYYNWSGLPQARYVPSYPPVEYDAYADESMNFCRIM